MIPTALVSVIVSKISHALTWEPVCLQGASIWEEYDGVYPAKKQINSPSGLIYYNSIDDEYIYPYEFDTGVEWRVGPHYTKPNAYLSCDATS